VILIRAKQLRQAMTVDVPLSVTEMFSLEQSRQRFGDAPIAGSTQAFGSAPFLARCSTVERRADGPIRKASATRALGAYVVGAESPFFRKLKSMHPSSDVGRVFLRRADRRQWRVVLALLILVSVCIWVLMYIATVLITFAERRSVYVSMLVAAAMTVGFVGLVELARALIVLP
jgi:hypothetical protein